MAKVMQVMKTIDAGCITERSMYTRIERGDSAQARAAKKECSTQARKVSNHRTLQRSLYFSMAANFKLTDFFLTLTFDDPHLPTRRKEVMRKVDKFVRLLRKHRILRKQDVRYIYCIESKHGDGRYHVHMVLNSTGQDIEAICSLWDGGSVDWEYIGWTKDHGKLQYRGEKGYKILARYMTKEIQPVGCTSSQKILYGQPLPYPCCQTVRWSGESCSQPLRAQSRLNIRSLETSGGPSASSAFTAKKDRPQLRRSVRASTRVRTERYTGAEFREIQQAGQVSQSGL